MLISGWEKTIRDISNYPIEIKDINESVMANSVNAANYDLVNIIEHNQSILEIGCGSYSWIKNNIPKDVTWDGIDIFDIDSRNRKSIATKIGSVHEIPFPNDSFHWVLSNQSMEHWFEYGVQFSDALEEIARVLRVGGQAHINFPFYLHGHPFFVKGDLESIISIIDKDIWDISDIIAFRDSEEDNYPGWRRCGFPDFYINKNGPVETSFVVNLILEKTSSKKDKLINNPESRELTINAKISPIRMAFKHGLMVLIWKIMRKIIRGRTGG